MMWPQESFRARQSGSHRLRDSATGGEARGRHPRSHAARRLPAGTPVPCAGPRESMLQIRWLVHAGTERSVPVPFLVVLLFWLTIIFASFGVFARRNATVLGALFVCAVSIGGAVFLVLEMDAPFDGLLRVSADPLRYAMNVSTCRHITVIRGSHFISPSLSRGNHFSLSIFNCKHL